MIPGGSTWFMDAAALGDWTSGGTARVLQDRLRALPADQRPAWMAGLAPSKVEEVLAKTIAEAVDASNTIQAHMDTERAKGRDFDEIYDEIKPYMDHASTPLGLEVGEDGAPTGTADRTAAEAQAPARDRAPPHLNLVAGFDVAAMPPSMPAGGSEL